MTVLSVSGSVDSANHKLSVSDHKLQHKLNGFRWIKLRVVYNTLLANYKAHGLCVDVPSLLADYIFVVTFS